MLGVDPVKLAQTQEVTKNITGTIVVDYKESSALITFATTDKAAKEALPDLLQTFTNALAQQLGSFFAIKGKIIERNKAA